MRRWLLALKWVGIILVLAGGLFLRTYDLNRQSYWMDEGYTVNAVISQLQNGTDHLSSILDSGERYFCPMYCLPTAVISQVFGEQPFSYRILAALFGMIFIGVVYLFTKAFFENKRAAMLAAFLTTFSYWQIAWSRQARWYTVLEVFFWLSFLFFHYFLKAETTKKKVIFLSLTAISTIIAIATQGISSLLPLLLMGWFIYEKRPKKRQVILAAIIALVFIVVTKFGLGLYFILPTLENIDLSNNVSYYIEFYTRNYWPFIVLGIYGIRRLSKEQRQKIFLLCIPFVAYILLIGTLSDIVQYRYLFHLTPIFYIVSSVITIDILAKIPNYLHKRALALLGVAVFFVLGLGIIAPKDFYTLEADDPAVLTRSYYAYTPQSEFTKAYEVIKKRIRPEEIVISSHPQFNKIFLGQPGYWLKYGYLGGAEADKLIRNNTEYYVNAKIITSKEEVEKIMEEKHGYVIFDLMSTDERIPTDIIQYIKDHSGLIFYDERNSYSQIWIYHF
ncbi:glycosyltransferase family 39 protein [Patescibacteria group bacterium]|nr:glycosyltransferase family 39 protein [Patescibacteria group bacterium]